MRVFFFYALFPHLSVFENIAFPLEIAGVEKDKQKQRVQELIELVGLKGRENAYPSQLSGGQKQMLSMARAFVNESKLLLIDEPSKGLAPIIIEKVMEAITEMKKHTSIVLVEQNFMMASKIGDTFTLIDDGRTVQTGPMKALIEDEQLKRKYLGIG